MGLLAEPERLRVVAALVLGARSPSQLIDATGLDQRAVGRAVQRLQSGGLVSTDHDGFTVHIELFEQVARTTAPQPKFEDHGYVDERTESAVRRFNRGWPATAHAHTTVSPCCVLEHLAQSFQPGLRYSEKEVDAERRAWRSGGWVDVLSP